MNMVKAKEIIGKLRRELRISQEKMAGAIGMSLTGYRKIEVGKTYLVHPKLEAISKVLKTTPEEILSADSSAEALGKIAQLEALIADLKVKLHECESEKELMKAEFEGKIAEHIAAINTRNNLIGILKDQIARYSNPEK